MNDPIVQRGRTPGDKPIVIGIAGGVGSGKSTVAAILDRLGCLVLDADAQARAMLDEPEIHDLLVEWWGDAVNSADGTIDRSAVASIVFDDDQQRDRLESLLHPLVIKLQIDAIRAADVAETPAVVLDAPLLFEAGMDALCDAVIFVETPEDLRIERVRATRGWSAAELARRQASQWSLEAKKTKSDFVVMNTGEESDLEKQVRVVYEQVCSKNKP